MIAATEEAEGGTHPLVLQIAATSVGSEKFK
jgi:hypothetical protein